MSPCLDSIPRTSPRPSTVAPTADRPARPLFALVLVTALLTGAAPGSATAASQDATPASPRTGTVLVLGDSLAAGLGVAPEEAFPALLRNRIRDAGYPFRVVNAGVSGDTTAGGLRRVDWLLRQGADVLVIELGGNDGLRGTPTETTEANLRAIIERARASLPRIEIVLAGMMVPPNLGATYTEAFREIFPRLAAETGAHLVPFLLEGVGGRGEYNLADGIHPNPDGHRILAENVWAVLEPVLRQVAARLAAPGP